MAAVKRKLQDLDERQRPAITLGDLAHGGIDVFCWCNRCSHNAVVPVTLLVKQLGPALPVPDVGVHMRCTGCGAKDVATRPAWRSPGQVSRHD